MSVLQLENVSYSYDKKTKAVSGVSFSVEKGEYVAIIGHNGSGKSTLSRLFNGLISPDEGSVFVCGEKLADKQSVLNARRKVGVVFQNPDNQLVASIVEDDVAFGPENLGINRAETGERIDYALKAVGMEEFRHASPERLSGGQKQRVAIAGVLALKPEILVLDESTSMLDPEGRKEVLSAVKDLNAAGVTVIAVTHYMEETVAADRVIVLTGGKIVKSGSPKEVFGDRKFLKDNGLETTLSAYIADKLREKGIPVAAGVLTENELTEELCRLARKN